MVLQNDFIELKEHNLWMGFNSENGWLIFDRNLPANKKTSPGSDSYLIKCSDWTFFKDKHYSAPKYNWVIKYLHSLEGENQKNSEEEAFNKLNEYISKKDEMKYEFIKIIHNSYLEKKGLSPRSIVKAKRFRESICWGCHSSVDNSFDYECNTCGWIICSSCGACKQGGC
jgi:hypothetical protein